MSVVVPEGPGPVVAPAVRGEDGTECGLGIENSNADFLHLFQFPDSTGWREMHMEAATLVGLELADRVQCFEHQHDVSPPVGLGVDVEDW